MPIKFVPVNFKAHQPQPGAGLHIEAGKAKEVYFPRRTFKALPTFTIPLATAFDQGG